MATYYLINTTIVGTTKYLSGDLLDSAVHPTTSIAAAGGILWPSADADVAAAAVIAQHQRLHRASNEAELESLMFAGAMSSLLGQTSAPLSDVAPGDVTTGAAAEGVAATASRSDHVHHIPKALAGADGAMAKEDKTFLDSVHSVAGAALTDSATQSIQVSGGYWRKLGAISQDSVLTLLATGAIAGDQITITRTDATSAHTYTIKSGPAVSTLFVMPNSKIACAVLQFDGTDWFLKTFGQQ